MPLEPIDLILAAINDTKSEVRADIAGVHDRLDTLNGRTRSVETTVAIHSWTFKIIGVVVLLIAPFVIKYFVGT